MKSRTQKDWLASIKSLNLHWYQRKEHRNQQRSPQRFVLTEGSHLFPEQRQDLDLRMDCYRFWGERASVSESEGKGLILRDSFIQSLYSGFLVESVSQESACNAGDPGSVPGWRRCPGRGNGNQLQYSCLENPMNTTAHRISRVGHNLETKPPPVTKTPDGEQSLKALLSRRAVT